MPIIANSPSVSTRHAWTETAIIFGIFFIGCSAFGFARVYPGYVHRDTEEIYMWSTLGFHFAFAKHPPFLPWLVGALNKVIPINWVTLTFLSALNLTIAAFAVFQIAVLAIGRARAYLVLAIYWLSPYALWQAIKFDHDSILVSTWPVFIWIFLVFLRTPTLGMGVLLGLMAAITIYAKYTSILLLVTAAAVSLMEPWRRRLYKTSAPYVALICFLVLVAPLAAVLLSNHEPVSYALNRIESHKWITTRMLWGNIINLVPLFIGFAGLYIWLGPRRQKETSEFLPAVATLILIPYVLMLATNAYFGLRGSPAWAMPAMAMVPVLLVSLLPEPTESQQVLLKRSWPALLVVLPVAGICMLSFALRKNVPSLSEPTIQLVEEAGDIWTSSFGQPAGVVAGDYNMSVTASFVLPEHPRAWPLSMGQPWWISPPVLDKNGILALCGTTDPQCLMASKALLAERGGWQCDIEARREWLGFKTNVHAAAYFIPPKDVVAKQSCDKTNPTSAPFR